MNKRNATMSNFYKTKKSAFSDNAHKHESVIAKTLKENNRTGQSYVNKLTERGVLNDK